MTVEKWCERAESWEQVEVAARDLRLALQIIRRQQEALRRVVKNTCKTYGCSCRGDIAIQALADCDAIVEVK